MTSKRQDQKDRTKKDSVNLSRGLATHLRSLRFEDKLETQARRYRLFRKRALLFARAQIAPAEYGSWLRRFEAQHLRETNRLKSRPVGSENLLGVVKGPDVSLSSELIWIAERLHRAADEINDYIVQRERFNVALWDGDATFALRILDELDERHGLSIRTISDRIAVEQIENGIEGQKAYVNSIKAQFKAGLVPYLAHYISVRNEPSVSWGWYIDDVNRRVSQSRYGPSVKSYLRYHFTGQWPKSSAAAANILKIEQSHSEVDMYETLLSFLQFASATGTYSKIASAISTATNSLEPIRDPVLQKVRLLQGESVSLGKFRESRAANELLAGRTRDAYRLALRSLRADPVAIEDAVVASFARSGTKASKAAQLGQVSRLWSEVIPNLATMFRRGARFSSAVDHLQKLAANLVGTECGRALGAVVNVEAGIEITSDPRHLKLASASLSRATFFEARAGIPLEDAADDPTASFFSRRDDQSPVPAITSMSDNAIHFSQAVRAADAQEWSRVADLTDVVQQTGHCGLRARAALLGMSARVRTNEVDAVVEAIEKAIEQESLEPNLLPHVEIVAGQTWDDLKPSATRMGLAITLDLALKATGDDRTATYRRFAFDSFLSSQGVDRASRLDPQLYENRTLTYFLRNIAVPSVLDMSDALESSKDIQEERRSILSMLTAIDPDEASTYQDEILEISDALEVAEGLKIVDSSRIHADIDVIEAWARRELADSYSRYRVLIASGIGVAEDFDVFLAGLKRFDDRAKNQFAIPDNEADDLLINVIRSLLNQFLYDSAHGLDSYLSRRIRHGSIVGFLRGPVEEAKLVTLRDERKNIYAENTHWLEALVDLDERECALISTALERFARGYDDALIRLRDDLLQIKDKDHPNGLLDMTLYAKQYHLIRSAIKDADSFTVFVAACFAAFWGILDGSLKSVKDHIARELRSALAGAFDELRATVNDLHQANSTDLLMGPPRGREGLAELNGAITLAQNNVQAALEDVATWFIRSETQLAKRLYTVQEAANIAKASALARLKTYDPEITLSVAEDWAIPSTDLSIMADIMLIGLGNACEHSGLSGDTPIDVSIDISPDKSLLIFSFRNPITYRARDSARLEVLDTIRNEVSSGAISDVVRKDRRSGLRKLGAMSAMSDVASLDFGFTDDDHFFLKLVLPLVTIHRVDGAENLK